MKPINKLRCIELAGLFCLGVAGVCAVHSQAYGAPYWMGFVGFVGVCTIGVLVALLYTSVYNRYWNDPELTEIRKREIQYYIDRNNRRHRNGVG